MKGLLTYAAYMRRESRLFDGFMFAWGMAMLLVVVSRFQVVFAYSADDQLMLTACQVCALIDTSTWEGWSIWILNGCWAC